MVGPGGPPGFPLLIAAFRDGRQQPRIKGLHRLGLEQWPGTVGRGAGVHTVLHIEDPVFLSMPWAEKREFLANSGFLGSNRRG